MLYKHSEKQTKPENKSIPFNGWHPSMLIKTFGEAVHDGGKKLLSYGIRFSNPNDTDLAGEFFSDGSSWQDATDFLWQHYSRSMVRPTLYQHGLNSIVGKEIIGRSTVKDIDKKGILFETELEASKEYEDDIIKLCKEGKLKYSTGTVPQLRSDPRDNGFIDRWGIVECSLTVTPCEPSLPPLELVKSWYDGQKETEYAAIKSILSAKTPAVDAEAVIEVMRQRMKLS